MKGYEFGRFLQAGQIGFKLPRLGLQGRKGFAEVFRLQLPCLEGMDEAFALTPDLREPPFESGPIRDQIARQAFALRVVAFDVGDDQVRMGQVGLQPVQDRPLDGFEIVGAAVIAGARLLHLRTVDAVPPLAGVLDRHARAARAAFQQARENALRSDRPARMRAAARLLDGEGAVVEVLVDDAQMRRVGGLPFGFRIGTRHAPAGIGVLDHADFVPDDPADIQLVEYQAVVPCERTVDRRSGPMATAGRRHAAPVQGCGNCAWSVARDVGRENLANDVGLAGLDLKFARLAGDGAVAVGAAPGMPPVADDAGQAAPDLVGKILEIERADEAADADLDMVGLAVMDGAEFDAEEAEPFPDAGQVLLIAREAVQRLDQDHVECFVPRRVEHAHEAVAAKHRRAGAGAVVEDGGDIQAVARRVGAAQCNLVVDRAVLLQLGREARVDRRAHRGHSGSARGEAAPASLRWSSRAAARARARTNSTSFGSGVSDPALSCRIGPPLFLAGSRSRIMTAAVNTKRLGRWIVRGGRWTGIPGHRLVNDTCLLPRALIFGAACSRLMLIHLPSHPRYQHMDNIETNAERRAAFARADRLKKEAARAEHAKGRARTAEAQKRDETRVAQQRRAAEQAKAERQRAMEARTQAERRKAEARTTEDRKAAALKTEQAKQQARAAETRRRAEAFVAERQRARLAEQQAAHRRETDQLRDQHREEMRSHNANGAAAVAGHAGRISAIDSAEQRDLQALADRSRTLPGRIAGRVRGAGHYDRQRERLVERHEAERMRQHRTLEALKDRQFEAAQRERLRQAKERLGSIARHQSERRALERAQEIDRPRQVERQLRAFARAAQVENGQEHERSQGRSLAREWARSYR